MKVAKSMRVGDPLDPATQMGAMVDGTQMERVLGYIEKGRSEGAKVALGGQRILSESGGYYTEPTVFDGVKNDMTIAHEEIFGPGLSTISFGPRPEQRRGGEEWVST